MAYEANIKNYGAKRYLEIAYSTWCGPYKYLFAYII